MNNLETLRADLEYYSSKFNGDRVRKAVRYMEEFDRTSNISSRKLATIKNVIRSCKMQSMVIHNTTPGTEAYMCS